MTRVIWMTRQTPLCLKRKKNGNVYGVSQSSNGKVPLASSLARKSSNEVQTDPLVSKMAVLSTDDYDKSNDPDPESELGRLKGVSKNSQILDPISDISECDFA